VLPVVACVALLVQLYSLAYMRRDAGVRRFFVLISVFTFAMLGLVASPNLFDSYLMWEGIGVCSFLLIGHWWHRPAAAAAAKKAFIVTRIGDLSLLLALVFTFNKLAVAAAALPTPPDVAVNSANNEPFNFQTMGVLWDQVTRGQVQGAGTRTLVVLSILVLVAALAKSAQLPFHVWLPDSAESPTPVTALIHASTMAGAGVYLVARMYPLFLLTPHVLTAVAIIGGLSAVLGAVAALAQTDIKRLIAWTTISHVGVMFAALGVGAFSAAIFTLVTHAWFKALLFLAAGSVIAAYGTQDIREMGGVWRRMRITAVCVLAGCSSAAGVVLFAGSWSNGDVLAGVLRNQFPNAGHVRGVVQAVVLVALCIALVLGAVAMFRMFFIAFTGEPKRRRGFQAERVREAPPAMLAPVVVLAVLSTVAGFVGIQGARYTFGKFVYAGAPDSFGFSWGGTLLSGGLSLAGVGAAWAIWGRGVPALASIPRRLGRLQGLAASGFRVDELYTRATARAVSLFGSMLPRADSELGDAIVDGAERGFADIGEGVRRLQTGRLQAYGIGAFAGLLVIAAGVTLAATGHFPGVGSAR
jgi:NADH-quinone oxidoreductase subunit L